MRKSAKALGLVVVSFLAAIALAVGSAFSAALSFGAVGLFVPGTGTPDANIVANYLANARDRYTQGTPCSTAANCTPLGINYPASFFPLAFIPGWCRSGPDGCDKWDDSVGQGTAALNKALTPYLDVNNKEDVTIFGYSQGGAVVSNVLNGLRGLDPSVIERLHVVTIGGIENPDGGLWSRLGFLPTIPFLDITFGPPMPTNTGIDTTAIGFQYDPVTYAPRYFGNALAVLNAFAALETVHGDYLSPDGTPPSGALPYGYTPTTLADNLNCTTHKSNCRYGSSGDTTYVMIPATSLPIFDLVMGAVPGPLKPLVQPFVNLLTPVTKLLIDLGYDWSGDPDKPTPLSILPFNPLTFNPIDFAVKFVGAIAQGIQDAIRGGPLPAVVSTVPTTNTVVSTTSTTPAVTAPQVSKLALVSNKLAQPAVAKAAVDAPVVKGPVPVAQEKVSGDVTNVAAVEASTPPQAPSADALTAVTETKTATSAEVTKDAPKETTESVKKDDTKDTTETVKKDTKDTTDTDTKKVTKDSVTDKSDTKDVKSTVKKDDPKKDAGSDGADAGKKAAA